MKRANLFSRSLNVALVLVAFSFFGAAWLMSSKTFAGRSSTLRIEPLTSVPTSRGITGRRVIQFRGGQCVVFRHPLHSHRPDDVWQAFAKGHEALEPYEVPPEDPWYVAPDDVGQLSTFNCATFAIGESIGLTTSDWLEPYVDSAAQGVSPTAVVLEHFYGLVATHPLEQADWEKLDSIPEILDGDVLVLVHRMKNEAEIAHLGKMIKTPGGNRVVSKMGYGPFVQGSIRRTAQQFEGHFNEIQFFRAKPASGR